MMKLDFARFLGEKLGSSWGSELLYLYGNASSEQIILEDLEGIREKKVNLEAPVLCFIYSVSH